MKISSVKSPTEFMLAIEALVVGKNIDYLEALMIYADDNGIEIETVASLVKNNDSIKSKLASHCKSINLLDK